MKENLRCLLAEILVLCLINPVRNCSEPLSDLLHVVSGKGVLCDAVREFR